ncbi:undecaprenyldiphospho-muramoylpentapeptide beta-N-acetylglucosaminyltransferase [Candidatus Igneacidithiobacillus taiwanensis]|uniref:undecaprenyldiphospho-muramoylpentapeptide beta-N-acetylglucosaminyltransferase n=1 Tax=Candidatus Igneacidithiobacillus taiwanensis TaxID=1945924 RepID=UPI00289DED53|nr:undecaprenyldiphospho-muramoylpentapeptide beta-N-acetylglucosaminyltransferase [Candidatus Igneacidithiobacillus taiwanensis]MCE5359951.1 undecaprenyldiphospho-muramoylpentapeptide beta-N-acetylglucosaminyltransferase [Acidithiobacillus sp.]
MAKGVLIAAGGTGGHIFPALAVAGELRARGVRVDWIGTSQGMEQRLVPAAGFPLHALEMQGLRGKGWRRWLSAPWRLARAVLQARRILRSCGAEAVLGMGGYVSAPAGLAAWSLGRRLCLHEQNAIPGLANRLLAPLAKAVFTGFPDTGLPKAQWVGNPVRAAIAELPAPALRFAGRAGEPAHLLIMGGSQGAQVINTLVVAAVAALPAAARPEIWHQCGSAHLENTQAAYAAAGVAARVEAFIDDMAAALAWADLAICRAGAATVAELCAAGLGSLLIPFPFAVDDHQAANARFIEDTGAGRMLRQEGLEATQLTAMLHALLPDRGLQLRWAEAARRQARTDAAQVVASACQGEAHA